METKKSSQWALDSFRRRLENVEGWKEIQRFVEQLVAERDELATRQEHLHSLARLFEKTVSDADDLAAQIRREAEETAQAQARDIVEQAEEKSRNLLEETRSQALLEAQDGVSAMRASAERELQASFKRQATEFQARVKEISERLHHEMLVQAEECTRRLTQFEGELEKSLSFPLVPVTGQNATGSIEAALKSSLEAAIAGQPASSESAAGSNVETEGEASEGRLVEIEILPPRDKAAIEAITAHLSGLREVAAVDVTHLTDRTMIHVLAIHPLDVTAELSGLGEVESAREASEGGRTKVQVVLAVRGELEREREALNMKARRLATRISRRD
jgi:flagellar biosynthesis/type III secretory pathway protein FliH